jgi:hypothetical protein
MQKIPRVKEILTTRAFIQS